MGKSRKANTKHTDLGRNLIKGKNIEKKNFGQNHKDSWLHTSEIQDGCDWNRLNLRSVTEQNTLDEFLETAELAGVEFTAEKLNLKIVGAGTITGVLGDAERSRIEKLHEDNKRLVTVPRRPSWNDSTTSEELELLERESFLDWRRSLALLQEEKGLLMTPYEKNLDVWRQLWRVIERSDVICQIVDGRNPLLYKSDDLESYVKETNELKENIVLINKADYLSVEQRKYWADYFTSKKSKVVFWSALEQIENTVVEEREVSAKLTDELHDFTIGESNQAVDDSSSEEDLRTTPEAVADNNDNTVIDTCSCPAFDHVNTTELASGGSLINLFKSFRKVDPNDGKSYVTIGLVGYPNVGKSSTINALLKEKKTAVSATPGKTKHFQTLFFDESLCLCDCPGLVFPTFISTKAEMVLNGILPIDQLRDWVAPSTILSQRIPKKIIENTYNINIPKPKEGEDATRAPTAEEVLSSYARMRGYMNAHGMPDCPRASRYVLKDYVRGKLLYCHPPPEISLEDYKPCRMTAKVMEKMQMREEKCLQSQKVVKTEHMSSVDKEFFAEKPIAVHFKTPAGSTQHQAATGNEQYVVHKPWKKHGNKNKKEKLRRMYDNQ